MVNDLTAKNVVIGRNSAGVFRVYAVDGGWDQTLIRLRTYSRTAFDRWLQGRLARMLSDLERFEAAGQA